MSVSGPRGPAIRTLIAVGRGEGEAGVGQLRLVGRREELDQISLLAADARLGRGSCLVLSGDAGIGKTALLRAAERSLQDFRAVRTSGVESDAELPYAGMVELLRPLLPMVPSLAPVQAAALEVALGLGIGAPPERLVLGAATLSLFARTAEESPLLILVDDAHWLDVGSAEALLFAARRIAADPVLMLVAQRTHEQSAFAAGGLDHLEIAGLSQVETGELLAQRPPAGGAVDQIVLAELYALTLGNPLGVLELANAPPPARQGGPRELTPQLSRTFARRLDELGARAAEAALVAASSYSGDAAEILAALTLRGLGQSDLEQVERAGLVGLSPTTIEFVHPLIRAAAYAQAYPDQRRTAHRALADGLGEARDVRSADERAWHLAAAAGGPDEAAAAALAEAADRARRRGALRAAQAAARRAAELSPSGRLRAVRLLAAADAALLQGDPGDAGLLVEQAVAATDDTDIRAQIEAVRTQLTFLRLSPLQVHDQLVAAATPLETADPAQAAALLATAAGAAAMGGDVRLALSTARRAHTLATSAPPPVQAAASGALALATLLSGPSNAAELCLKDAVSVVRDADPLDFGTEMTGFLVLNLLWVEEFRTCEKILSRALHRFREISAPERLINLLVARAEFDFRHGQWDSAVAATTESIDLARELNQPIGEGYALAILAKIAGYRGEHDTCRNHTERAMTLLAPLQVALVAPYVAVAAAINQLYSGDTEGGYAALSQLHVGMHKAHATNPAILEYDGDLIDAAWRLGHADTARDLATALEHRLGDTPPARGAATLARCHALIDPSEDRYTTAERLAANTADSFLISRVQQQHGEWLRRANRKPEARDLLTKAAAGFTHLRAEPFTQRTLRELHTAGAPRARARETGAALTPQELQVAELAAQGKSNKQIAEHLYLSVKTVEYHLSHVYDKTGVRSRTQMIQRLPDLTTVNTSPDTRPRREGVPPG